MSTTRTRRAAARRAATVAIAAAGALAALPACRSPHEPFEPAGAAPAETALGPSAVPDSILRSPGLPPRSGDSATAVLGPAADTVVQTSVLVVPPWSARASQVAPGAPTSGGMRVELRVLGRTPDPNRLVEVPLPLAECPLALRLHRRADRTDAAAWRSEAVRGALACPPVRRYGASDVTAAWDVAAMLGDSLPAGRYFLAFDVRLGDGRVLPFTVGGGYLTADPTPPVRDFAALRYAVTARVEGAGPRTLVTTAWVRNPSARWLQFEYGACALQLHLFRTVGRTGTPVWRSDERRPPGSTSGYACPAILLGAALPPGDSLPIRLALPLPEILSDAVRPDRYYGTAVLELLDDSRPPSEWERTVRLDAGAIDLPGGADPLPAVRLVNGVRAEATTRLVPGAGGADTVRTLALLTNTTDVPRTLEVPRDCPVIVYAYRTAERRDAVPIADPAWRSTRPCQLVPHRFTLAPGASWVFQHDVPAATLRAGVGAGRVWLTAWLAGTPSVLVAAGDVGVP